MNALYHNEERIRFYRPSFLSYPYHLFHDDGGVREHVYVVHFLRHHHRHLHHRLRRRCLFVCSI
jgi:hypothetical protein